jgi:hypothetical protein
VSHHLNNVLNLKDEKFCIKNDLFFGWKPNIGIQNPFPLFYNDRLADALQISKVPLYRGFRPPHSYRLHEFYSGEKSYPFQSKSFRLYMNKEI